MSNIIKSPSLVDFRKFKRFHCEYCSSVEYSYYRTIYRRAIIDLLCKHGLVFAEQIYENFDNCLFVKNWPMRPNEISYKDIFEQMWALEDKINPSQQELDNLISMLCNYDTDIFMVGAQTLQHLSIDALKCLRSKRRTFPSVLLKIRYNKKNIHDLLILTTYYISDLL